MLLEYFALVHNRLNCYAGPFSNGRIDRSGLTRCPCFRPSTRDYQHIIMDENKTLKKTTADDIPVNVTVAEDCAYVVFKDKKIVTLYSNDLDGIQGADHVMDPDDHPNLADIDGGLGLFF